MIRFYENAEQFTEIREGVTVTGWKWDEYHLEMNGYTGLLNDVTANHDTLLAQAQRVEYEANANDIIQAATDELMIDHEERLIYLELGV